MNASAGKDGGSLGTTDAGLRDGQATGPASTGDAVVADTLVGRDQSVPPDFYSSTPDAGKADRTSAGPEVNLPDVSDPNRSDAVKSDLVPDAAKPDLASAAVKPDLVPDQRKPDIIASDMARPDLATPDVVTPDTTKPETSNDVVQADAGILVSGILVLTYKDYGPADTQCVDATTGWIDSVATFLAEDRKCWSDTDCMYVSFANSCGQVCAVPMNVQRTSEFYNEAIGNFDSKCSTCPTLESYPSCPMPPADGELVCKNNICDWK